MINMAEKGELKEFFKEILTAKGIYNIAISFILLIGALYFNTFIHELGHIITGRIMGCQTSLLWSSAFTGASAFQCPDTMPEDLLSRAIIVTALAGPLFSFIVSLLIWFAFGENSVMRLIALVGFLYSVLPNLSFMTGSDLSVAVEYGLPYGWALLIVLFVTGIIGYLLLREITESDFPITDTKWF